VVVGGFILIGFIGIVAALLIPNFIDALGKARQKRTVADLHAIAAGLDAYYASEGRYPEAATAAELAATLTEAGLLTATPVLDGWKHPLGYTCWPGEPGADGCDDYRLASAGADGEFEHENLADYPGETTERSDFTRDIVRGPEGLIQGPGDG
jgi:type II secretory pathway pseudopilin PulG